ncbi:hypothetical protein GCM10023310_15160 [Paenibacillus vulneris]|uniref:Uncharacterized protein n=1 Tax=Paenibacillus vulneris TaxID=1133364 RepID=A0ABW3UKR0_9BACL
MENHAIITNKPEAPLGNLSLLKKPVLREILSIWGDALEEFTPAFETRENTA